MEFVIYFVYMVCPIFLFFLMCIYSNALALLLDWSTAATPDVTE